MPVPSLPFSAVLPRSSLPSVVERAVGAHSCSVTKHSSLPALPRLSIAAAAIPVIRRGFEEPSQAEEDDEDDGEELRHVERLFCHGLATAS